MSLLGVGVAAAFIVKGLGRKKKNQGKNHMARAFTFLALAASFVLSAAPAMAAVTVDVPEPASMTLLGAGIAAIGIANLIRRKKKWRGAKE